MTHPRPRCCIPPSLHAVPSRRPFTHPFTPPPLMLPPAATLAALAGAFARDGSLTRRRRAAHCGSEWVLPSRDHSWRDEHGHGRELDWRSSGCSRVRDRRRPATRRIDSDHDRRRTRPTAAPGCRHSTARRYAMGASCPPTILPSCHITIETTELHAPGVAHVNCLPSLFFQQPWPSKPTWPS